MRGIFIFASLAILSMLTACSGEQRKSSRTAVTIQGNAQGTTYTITYVNDSLNYQPEVDSLLESFDRDVSLWKPNSVISRVNEFSRKDTVFSFYDTTRVFSLLFELSHEIYEKTEGAFDPTVYPLVEAWGFGLENREEMKEEQVDSVLQYVGFEPFRIDLIESEKNYQYESSNIRKGRPETRLDFNAIAQGYSVDLIGDLLDSKGISDYMIELGGEVKCKGKNAFDEYWRIAIDKPVDQMEREFEAVIRVENKAIATSGSYRKYYELDGKKYSHTIDPRNGYPVEHNLLSATVLANDCSIADAYATAFMVMGVEGTAEFLAMNPDLDIDVYLLYDSGDGIIPVISEGMKKYVEELE